MSALKSREGNIEALRVFLMFSIVFGHLACQGYYKDTNLAQGLGVMTVYAVDCFAFISGWYAIKLGFGKIFRLLGIGLFVSLLHLALSPIINGGRWYFEFSLGWFGNSYVGLMLLAPFLNLGAAALEERFPRKLGQIWLGLFAILVLCWLPLPLINVDIRPSGWGSHTVSTLVFMYLTGRLLATAEWPRRVRRWVWCAAFVACVLAILGFAAAGHCFRNNGTLFGWLLNADAFSYWSPFCIAAAVALFFIARSLPNGQLFGWTKWVAPSVFSIYLLHGGGNRVVAQWLYPAIGKALSDILGDSMAWILPNLLVSTLLVMLVCVVIDRGRGFLVSALAKHLEERR